MSCQSVAPPSSSSLRSGTIYSPSSWLINDARGDKQFEEAAHKNEKAYNKVLESATRQKLHIANLEQARLASVEEYKSSTIMSEICYKFILNSFLAVLRG